MGEAWKGFQIIEKEYKMANDQYLLERPVTSLESTIKMFLVTGAILCAGLLASGHWSIQLFWAFVCFGVGVTSFSLLLMFIVTIKLNVAEGLVKFGRETEDWRLVFPAILGMFSYLMGYFCVALGIYRLIS